MVDAFDALCVQEKAFAAVLVVSREEENKV
jgi:hypothetical protein